MRVLVDVVRCRSASPGGTRSPCGRGRPRRSASGRARRAGTSGGPARRRRGRTSEPAGRAGRAGRRPRRRSAASGPADRRAAIRASPNAEPAARRDGRQAGVAAGRAQAPRHQRRTRRRPAVVGGRCRARGRRVAADRQLASTGCGAGQLVGPSSSRAHRASVQRPRRPSSSDARPGRAAARQRSRRTRRRAGERRRSSRRAGERIARPDAEPVLDRWVVRVRTSSGRVQVDERRQPTATTRPAASGPTTRREDRRDAKTGKR